MAIPLLNLDDRTFDDINDELRALIPRYAPAWTNHNTADPGITVMELFAWLTEALIYRINRVPDTSRRRFMELLGAAHAPAAPAVLRLRVRSGRALATKLPRYTQLLVYPDDVADPIPFETLEDVEFSAAMPEHTLTVRQTALLENVKAGSTSGVAYQLLRLDDPFALPAAPFPRPPQVYVDSERWEYVPSLRQSGPTDRHFTVKPRTNMVLFGDGAEGRTGGAIPARGAAIVASWRTALTPETWQRWRPLGRSSGAPYQVYRLPVGVLAVDLQSVSDLQPQVTVGGERWDYCSSLLDSALNSTGDSADDSADALSEFTVEPWSNGLRFGDGVRGRKPPAHADVTVTYRATLGQIEPFETGTYFAFMQNGQVTTSLRVLAHAVVSKGTAATALGAARQSALTLLKQPWRGITCQDLTSIILPNQRDTFSLQSVAGDLLADRAPAAYEPAQIGVVVTPKPRYVLQAGAARSPCRHTALQLGDPICIAPDGSSLVTAAAAAPSRVNRLWNLAALAGQAGSPATDSAAIPATAPIILPPGKLHDLAFTPDGTRLVLTTRYGNAWLFDTATGLPIKLNTFSRKRCLDDRLPRDKRTHGGVRQTGKGRLRVPAAISLLSPDGSRWLTVSRHHNIGVLRLPEDGSIYSRLASGHIVHAAFSPDSTLLATAHAAHHPAANPASHDVILRRADDGAELVRALPAPAAVTGLAFSPDSRVLAVLESDNRVTLYRAKDGGAPWIQGDRQIGTIILPVPLAPLAPGHGTNLLFSPTGKRLLTLCADGAAYLWSLQTCTQITRLAHAGPLQGPIRGAVYSADGSRLGTYDDTGHVCVWGAQPGTLQFDLDLGVEVVAAAFNATATCLAAIGAPKGEQGPAQGAAAVWDLQRGGRPLLQRSQLADTAINISGQWLAWIDDNLVTVWDIEHSSIAATLHHGRADVSERVHFAWQSYPGPLLTTVTVVPSGDTPKNPTGNLPVIVSRIRIWNAQQVQQVQQVFDDRHLVTSKLGAGGPAYSRVGIQATLVRALPPKQSRAVLAAAVTTALLQFFDPLTCGPNGSGWQLGRPIYRSEVYQVLEQTRGIDHVEALAIQALDAPASPPDDVPDFGDGQAEQIDIPPHHLVNCVAAAIGITVRDPERMPFIVTT